ncbi:hypothetical protein [Halomonas koreensis]|uniref:Uncharacterized protein n=1 Tax=Halomonas koreensis TaxID=245385 RepID=A0ABU1FYD0_9GAMM|nr:hypothetical protein [Halomonas koreensis]MDR5865690.1 hypothetical protein [Halomonas koreensis]
MSKAPKARREIEAAYEHISNMESAETLEEFQKNWEHFLNDISRAWDKTTSYFKHKKEWNKINSKYKSILKNDPLLKYLKIARNIEYHGIKEITEHQPATTTISSTPPKPGFKQPDGSTVIPAQELLKIRLDGPRVKLISLEDRGKTFHPPTTHRGKPIDQNNIIEVAKKAADFYQEVLQAAQTEINTD